MIRVVAALALLLVGCGDDTTTAPPQDLSTGCSEQCCPGNRCAPAGASCSGFETFCTCANDATWHCHGPLPPPDFATPVFTD